MLYKRTIFPKLESELEHKEITVITGMRRVGKTTALTHLYGLVKSENKVVLNMDNPLHRGIFEVLNYDAIWNNLKSFGVSNNTRAYIFIDEIQNLPEISRAVKYLYDHWDIKFVLTGSSSYYLRNLFPESLAGRKLIFELFPLSFPEFLIFRDIKREIGGSFEDIANSKNEISYRRLAPFYDEYMEYGGFPSVVLENDIKRKKDLLMEIFVSYFEKDAKNLADFKDMNLLRDLILLLVPRVGQKVDVQKLAKSLSISRPSIYSYLSFLEQTYFVSFLNKFSANIDRQSAGSKKIFMCDSGIVNVLGRVSTGQVFEQSVFQNLRHDHKLNYYSQGSSNEIDFVVDESTAIEVKYSASPRDFDSLEKRMTPLNLKKGFIVSHEYTTKSNAILVTDL